MLIFIIPWLLLGIFIIHKFTSPSKFGVLSDDIKLIFGLLFKLGWPIVGAIILFLIPAFIYLMLIIFTFGIALVDKDFKDFLDKANTVFSLLGIGCLLLNVLMIRNLLNSQKKEQTLDIVRSNIQHIFIFLAIITTLSTGLYITKGFNLPNYGWSTSTYIYSLPSILILFIISIGLFLYRNYSLFIKEKTIAICYISIIIGYSLGVTISFITALTETFNGNIYHIFMIYNEYTLFRAGTVQLMILGIYLLYINNSLLQGMGTISEFTPEIPQKNNSEIINRC